jgi:hypothetical protein
MTNRRTLGGLVGTVIVLTVVAVYQENIAAWLEANKLNRLLLSGGLGAALGAIGRFLASPWLTHFYAFAAGMIILAILQAVTRSEAQATSDKQYKPNMTLAAVANYLTTASQWAADHPGHSEQMVQLELIDALASGQVTALGRLRSAYDTLSPLYRVDRSYFNDVHLDVTALRQGRDNAIRPVPGVALDHYVDLHVWRSDVETVWPPRKPVKRQLRQTVSH